MRVSVIMAAYGQAEYVAEAIESVLAQTYADWQLTVVDDGSPDNVAEIVGESARRDSRIRFVATPN
ncbi:MAG: glycosyltransferase, partial [Muribaculaceae bacterium]|nr:glycosyltransferase [Muribaculaceae bacterium]